MERRNLLLRRSYCGTHILVYIFFCSFLCPCTSQFPIDFVHKFPSGAPRSLEFPCGDLLFSLSWFFSFVSIKYRKWTQPFFFFFFLLFFFPLFLYSYSPIITLYSLYTQSLEIPPWRPFVYPCLFCLRSPSGSEYQNSTCLQSFKSLKITTVVKRPLRRIRE